MNNDIKEKLKRANGVEVDKKPNDKERIAQLEAEKRAINSLHFGTCGYCRG